MHLAILLAGGSGNRMGSSVQDKLLHPIGDSNAFRLSIEAFLAADSIHEILIVFRDEGQRRKLERELSMASEKVGDKANFTWVEGGKERKDSVRNALVSCPPECEFVHVHDCARPMIRHQTIDLLAKKVALTGAVAVARPLRDTIKRIPDSSLSDSVPQETASLDRSSLWLMETPQCSQRSWLEDGLAEAERLGTIVTDEISALELVKRKVCLIDPGYPNPKITTTEDLAYLEHLLKL